MMRDYKMTCYRRYFKPFCANYIPKRAAEFFFLLSNKAVLYALFNPAMFLAILLIVSFPTADFAKANGPLDIVVLCDESKYMELVDSSFYYDNFAKFVEQFLPQANSLNFYAIVGCGKPETRRKEKRHVPFESIKMYCKSNAENERNYDKCLLYADHENIFVLDEENRPNVNDVFFSKCVKFLVTILQKVGNFPF